MIIDRLLAREKVHRDEHLGAIGFFWDTTGIAPQHYSWGYASSWSIEGLREDREKWMDWYRKNEASLVFDSYTGHVLVDEDVACQWPIVPHPPRYGDRLGVGVLSYQLENSSEGQSLVTEMLIDGKRVATVLRRGKELELSFDWENPEHLTLDVDDLEKLLTELRALPLD